MVVTRSMGGGLRGLATRPERLRDSVGRVGAAALRGVSSKAPRMDGVAPNDTEEI